jgi:hypothetical protein
MYILEQVMATVAKANSVTVTARPATYWRPVVPALDRYQCCVQNAAANSGLPSWEGAGFSRDLASRSSQRRARAGANGSAVYMVNWSEV